MQTAPMDLEKVSLEGLHQLKRMVGDAAREKIEAEITARTSAPAPAPKAREQRRNGEGLRTRELEHLQQVALITKLREIEPAHPELELLYAIPNGGQRSPAQGGKLKAEGVRRGVLDLHLPVARGPFIGLWLENKVEYPYIDPHGKQRRYRGQLSEEQERWVARLRAHGHRVEVFYTAGEAIGHVLDYLALPARLPEAGALNPTEAP